MMANNQHHVCATLHMGNKVPAGFIQCASKQETLQAVHEPYENKRLAFQTLVTTSLTLIIKHITKFHMSSCKYINYLK